MQAEMLPDHVRVAEQADANRVHNKGQYGTPLSGGALRLEFVEAAYLQELGRIGVRRDGGALAWADLLAEATRVQPGFGILYLVYRDLRERGFIVRTAPPRERAAGAHFLQWDRGDERRRTPRAWIRAESERGRFVLDDVHAFAHATRAGGAVPRLAVVDEESDLTYYELDQTGPSGQTAPTRQPGARGLLLEDRVLVADPGEAKALHASEFFGRPVGTGLHLSLVEAIHLAGRDALEVTDASTGRVVSAATLQRRSRKVEPHIDERLAVYGDLKERGLVVKTGFKFGTHFRAYAVGPEEAHAPHLIQAVPSGFESPWEPLARAVRLSHSVRKRFHLAEPRRGGVRYLAFDRYRA